MDAARPAAQSSTPDDGLFAPAAPGAGGLEEDFAIGCECANPALQIDCWSVESSANAGAPAY